MCVSCGSVCELWFCVVGKYWQVEGKICGILLEG